MKKSMRFSQNIYLGCSLLVMLLLLAACDGDANLNMISVANDIHIDNSALVDRAIQMETQLYGNANTYATANVDEAMQETITYWAYNTCGFTNQEASWEEITAVLPGCSLVSPGTLQCNTGTCAVVTAGSLQCVEFVTGAFGSLGDALPISGNGNQFWANYQSQPGWTEVSPNDISSGNNVPYPGDIIGFTNNNPNGHVGIVVAVQAPQGGNDGYIIVASGNQPGNVSAADLAMLGATRGNFYKLPWHTQDYLNQHSGTPVIEGYGGDVVQGFIRHVTYSNAASVAGSGTFPSCTADALGQPLVPLAPTPYADPLLKTLLATAYFQSAQVHTWVNDAWCVAIHDDLPPAYFVLQVEEESGFDPSSGKQNYNPNGGEATGALGLIQITKDALNLVGNDGESDTVLMPNCVYDLTLPPDCMGDRSYLPAVTMESATNDVVHNLEVGARTMLDKLLYNLSPEGTQIDQLQASNQQNAAYSSPLNAKVQACVTANYAFTTNPDCLEGLARAMVSYNGGQGIADGYNETQMKNDNSCKAFVSAQPTQWLQCLWDNQASRNPADSNDGNHPNDGTGVHEAARYVINIFDYLPVHANWCEGDNTSDLVQQTCKDELAQYPQSMLGFTEN